MEQRARSGCPENSRESSSASRSRRIASRQTRSSRIRRVSRRWISSPGDRRAVDHAAIRLTLIGKQNPPDEVMSGGFPCVAWSLRSVSVGHDREVDAFPGFRRCDAEMIHRQALCRAPVDADAAADAAPLVDDHCRGVRAKLGPGHLGQLHVIVDRVDPLRRDHLDAPVWAGIDAAIAEDAAVAVDENIELALEATLGLLEADRLGETDFDLERRVQRADAAIPDRQRRHNLPADPRVIVAPDEAAAHCGQAPLGNALRHQRIRRRDELGRDACQLHLADPRLGATQLLVDQVGDALALADRRDEVGRVDHVVARGPDVRELGAQVLVEERHAAAIAVWKQVAKEAAVLLLADRDQDHVAGNDELGARNRFRSAATLLVRLAELILLALEADNLAVLADHLDRGDQVHDLDALDLRLFELELFDRDLLDRAPIGHDRGFGAHSHHAADTVHRGEATTDGDAVLADPDILCAEVNVLEELEARHDTVKLLARDAEALRGLAAGRDQDGVKVVDQILEGEVTADLDVVADLDAEIKDLLDFFHDDVAGQAPLRHSCPHHATRHRLHLEDGDLVALACKLPGRAKAVDPGADDTGSQAVPRRRNLASGLATVIGRDPLQVADADRRIDFLTAAGLLAGAGAHSTQAAREDIVLPIQLIAIGIPAVGNQRDIPG